MGIPELHNPSSEAIWHGVTPAGRLTVHLPVENTRIRSGPPWPAHSGTAHGRRTVRAAAGGPRQPCALTSRRRDPRGPAPGRDADSERSGSYKLVCTAARSCDGEVTVGVRVTVVDRVTRLGRTRR